MQAEELKNIRIEDYTYELPEERIAKYPLEDRKASRLLVYEEGKISQCNYSDVTDLLAQDQVLVYNNTRVIFARMLFHKPTGAAIEVFCLEPHQPADYAVNFASKHACEWKCMVGNLKKWKSEKIYTTFEYNGTKESVCAEKVIQAEGGEVIVRFSWDADLTFSEVLEYGGKIPIPPYLNREADDSDKIRYQTIYSKEEGSVAAPTAGLHFTSEVLEEIVGEGVRIEELTLHVGAGTFRPVKSETIGEHDMHTEHVVVALALLESLMNAPKEIIGIGTTSVRTLESIYWMGVKLLEGKEDFNQLSQWEAYTLPTHYTLKESMKALYHWLENEEQDTLKAQTTIIIVPGYQFKVLDGFFTNFHQPQSTLLLLVAAAVGEDWRKIYQYALGHEFRFLSYGDGSFLKVSNKSRQ